MSANRDDMVIRVRFKPPNANPIRQEAKVHRVAAAVRRRTEGIASGLARSAATRTALRSAVAEEGLLGRAAASPWALAAAAAVVASAVVLRDVTGRSFEGMGQDLSYLALGDLPAEQVASTMARQRLAGHPLVAELVGRRGIFPSLVKDYEDLQALYERQTKGAALIVRNPAFQVDSLLDASATGIAEGVKEAFRSGELRKPLEEWAEQARQRRTSPLFPLWHERPR